MSKEISRSLARHLAPVVASAAMLLLAACGGHSGTTKEPQVASVPKAPGASARASADATDPVDARPLVREDTSEEEFIRLLNVWGECLRDHGIPSMTDGKGQVKSMDDGSPRYAPARKACAAKEPEDFKDRLARQHPAEYQDLFRKAVACAKSKGWAAVRPDPKDPTQIDMMADSSMPIADKMDIWGACEKEAFATRN